IRYTNSTNGIRQDFIIHEGPKDKVNIKVDLKLTTELTAEKADQFSIIMTDKNNKAVHVHYKDLIVYDAEGKFLQSEMVLNQDGEGKYNLDLIAYGENVSYPITVD